MNRTQKLEDFFSSLALTPDLDAPGNESPAPGVPQACAEGASWHSGLTSQGEPVLVFVVHGFNANEVRDAATRVQLVNVPGLIRIHDIVELTVGESEQSDAVAVVYKSPTSSTLAELTRNGALPSETARAIAGRAAEILENAGRKGIRHYALDEKRIFIDIDSDEVHVLGAGIENATLGSHAFPHNPYTASPDALALGRILYVGLAGRGPEFFASDAPANPAKVSPRTVPAELGIFTEEILTHTDISPDNPPLTVKDIRAALSPWQSLPVTVEAFDAEQHAGPPVPLSERPEEANESTTAEEPISPATPASLDEPTELSDEADPSCSEADDTTVPASVAGAVASSGVTGGALLTPEDSPETSPEEAQLADSEETSGEHSHKPVAWGDVIDTEPRTAVDETSNQASGPILVSGRRRSMADDMDISEDATREYRPLTKADLEDQEKQRSPRKPALVPPSSVTNSRVSNTSQSAVAIPVRGRSSSLEEPQEEELHTHSLFREVVGVALDSTPATQHGQASAKSSGISRGTQSKIVLIAALLLLVLGLVYALTNITSVGRANRDVASSPTTVAQASPTPSESPSAEPEKSTEPTTELATLSEARIIYPPDQSKADYPENANRLTDGDPGTVWKTQRYKSATFGGLREGMGVHLAMSDTGVVTSITITSGTQDGGDIEVRPVGEGDEIGEPIATGTLQAGQDTTITLPEPVDARDLVLWAPNMGAVSGGYRLEIAEITINKE